MVLISRFHKKCRISYLRVALLAAFLAALFTPSVRLFKSEGNNMFTVMVDGKEMGTADTELDARRIINEARRQIAGASNDLVLIEAETKIVGSEVLKGVVDDRDEVIKRSFGIQKICEGYDAKIVHRQDRRVHGERGQRFGCYSGS